jgi:hypothetical protein
MLVGCGAILLQLRSQGGFDLGSALVALTAKPLGILVVLLFATVLATMVAQAFSFTAIRLLEGYWHGPLVKVGAYRLLIRHHTRRYDKLTVVLRSAEQEAFARARQEMLSSDTPLHVVHIIEARQAGDNLDRWTTDEQEEADEYDWREYADASTLGRVNQLGRIINGEYPERPHRMMPTRLGNMLRATEDVITPQGGDTEGLMLRRSENVAPRLRQHHDQFRTRLDMYCTLVFIQVTLAGLTLILLLPTKVPLVATLLTTVGFTGLAVVSYSAAIASAQGYCSTLRAIFANDSKSIS